jgi:hypothetical protein
MSDEPDWQIASAELTAAAVTDGRLGAVASLDAREQRRLFREVGRLARGFRREGASADEAIPRIVQHIARNPNYAGILLTVLLAALAATVQFWVRKWWEKWFQE